MLKLIILKGIPASGKSSWAKEFIEGKENWVIVSRDSIRESAGEYWVPSRENYITEIEDFSIKSALRNKLNVIVDATNLNESRNKRFGTIIQELKGENIEVTIEYKEFPINIELSIERDEYRERRGKRSVGKKCILDFARRYFPKEYAEYYTDKRIKYQVPLNPDKKNAIICDLDGTLCLHNGRPPFDYSLLSTDVPNNRLVDLISNLSMSYTILFVSGREGTKQCINDSKEWIFKNIPNIEKADIEFFFRKEKDFRPDEIIKKEIYKSSIEPYYNVISVFDDRDKVVSMWRDLHLLTCQVNYGNF